MRKFLVIIFCLAGLQSMMAQELNCEIIINAEQTGQSNQSVFRTLQRSLTDFVNQSTWTNLEYEDQERINCSMFITINSYEGESFTGSIQVQSSRPVFGTSMITPVFNFNDEQFNFNYREYQPLNYSANSYTSNLVSVISFYVYTIIGLDADTFELNGGTEYFEEANRIVTTAQQGNSQGWRGADGSKSRYRLNTNLLSNTYAEFRTAMYQYHRLGLDVMHEDLQAGKLAVAESLETLESMNTRRANSLLLRTFFDSKADEIGLIFSGGPPIPLSPLVETLNNIAPRYSKSWNALQ
ncbi:DUF4835 family protein [Zunongwangia sp. F363]|uniref:DUF4835 family protein n=1 Tax=Autumnicola tepida TaxID=3075595 RepID=A0ABU3CDH6_9FLAO|nr:DUF4835 family protein [Zunongwangia sp. F363]MDT0644356.1 DUF4835 family protein [Zunongwangia sp. F363]